MSLLYAFSYDKVLEPCYMDICRISGSLSVAALDGFKDHFMFLRHVFGTSEVIIIYVPESEYQLLELFDHLHQYLVVAGFDYYPVKSGVESDHVFHVAFSNGIVVFGSDFPQLFELVGFHPGRREKCSQSLHVLAHFKYLHHIAGGDL